MADIAELCAEALRRCRFDVGQFYGPADNLNLGAGLIYTNVGHPLFNPDSGFFDTVEGVVLVLTHECDVDSANLRHFNDLVACLPVTPLGALAQEMIDTGRQNQIESLLRDITLNAISRVLFLPPVHGLPEGGYVYLNQMCSSPVSLFPPEAKMVALSAYGLRHLDLKLENHFRRAKAEPLPLSY